MRVFQQINQQIQQQFTQFVNQDQSRNQLSIRIIPQTIKQLKTMKGATNTQEGSLRTTSQKRRAALQGSSTVATVTKTQATVANEVMLECTLDGGKLTPASTAPSMRNHESASNRKSMREGLQALRASDKATVAGGVTGNNLGGVTSASDNPNNFEETTTHEDRKISNISEMPFGENIGSTGVACISSADNRTAKFGKSSPSLSQSGKASTTQRAVAEEVEQSRNDVQDECSANKQSPFAQAAIQHLDAPLPGTSSIYAGAPSASASVCGSSSSLQPHPFNVLIAEFQHKRQIAGSNSQMRKQATVFEFLSQLKKNIKDLDQQYYVYKKLRRQENQQQFGIGQGSGDNAFGSVQQQTSLTQQMSFGNDVKNQNQSLGKHHGLNDCQVNTDHVGKSLLTQEGQGENDENSSELANTGQLGINSNLSGSHIFGQFGAEIGGLNGSNNQSIYQPHHHFEPFSSFEFQPNQLQYFYPKQVQRQLHKKKYSHSEKIIHGLKAPHQTGKGLGGLTKHAMKLKALGECQMQMMRIILQRIDRKSRPIRKQERIVSDNLKRRNVQLDEENPFDIIQLIQSSYSHKAAVQQLQQQSHQQQINFGCGSQTHNQGYQSCSNEDTKQTPKIKLPEVYHAQKPQSTNKQTFSNSVKEIENPEEDDDKPQLATFQQKLQSPTINHRSPINKQKIDHNNVKIEFPSQGKIESYTEPHNQKGKKTAQRLAKDRGSVSIRKLQLTKSQSVALPLSNQDVEMKDDEGKLQAEDLEDDLISERNIAAESTIKNAVSVKKIAKPTKANPESEQIIETVAKENGSFSFKIKIPTLAQPVQSETALMPPLQLTKSKSYTHAGAIQKKKLNKRNQGKTEVRQVNSQTPTHGQKDHSYYDTLALEDHYMEQNQPQYECDCMLSHNQHEHNVQINNYFLYGDANAGIEEEICTCCQVNDDQLPHNMEGLNVPQRFSYPQQIQSSIPINNHGQDQSKFQNSDGYLLSGGRPQYSQPHTVSSTHLNHSVNRELISHDFMPQRVPLGQIGGKSSRTIDFFDYGNDIDGDGQRSLGLTNFFNNDHHPHLGITPEIPSVGKDLGKLSFFGMDPPAPGSSSTDMIGGVPQPLRQESPDPQGTTVRMINNQPMMLVDSATPMFTSEFTINGGGQGLHVGGLEIPNLQHHHHSMINEWNPINMLEPSNQNVNGVQGGQQTGLLLHHSHSHDSCFYGGFTVGAHLHGASSGSNQNNQGNSFDLRLV